MAKELGLLMGDFENPKCASETQSVKLSRRSMLGYL